jgi:hypothetical protein
VVCTAQDQCHDVGTCDTTTGVCSNPNKADDTACSDGNACTQRDVCRAGVCTGTNPVVCTAQDQCHDVGTCDTTTGACTNPNKADDTACSDGNACTQRDVCRAGVCTGTMPVVCTAQDQCHDVGTCDTTTGACSNPNKADGTGCDDHNACTQTDFCQTGQCNGFNPVICAAADQCHDVGVCRPETGKCTSPEKADGTACNDSDACTRTDVCMTGVCTGTNPVVCAAADQCHNAGTCDSTSGVCSNPAKPDNTLCDDADACTQRDVCRAGACTGTTPVVCSAQDVCHNPGTCDHVTGACTNPAAPDGTACDDANACTQRDACSQGRCVGSSPVVCTAQDQCHAAGTCDPTTGACSNPAVPDNTACDDANACTQRSSCQVGRCVGTNPVVCTAQDQCHLTGVCDPSTGACTNPKAADGTSCNDGNACFQTDICQSGVCTGTNPVICPPPDQCHIQATCVPSSGTCPPVAKPDQTACDDGSPCTSGDACKLGVCTPGLNRCVSLTVAHVSPTTRSLTEQTTTTLVASPTSAVPGDPLTFTATVTNTGVAFTTAQAGTVTVTNTNRDTPFTVVGYRFAIESLAQDGVTWNPVAVFERDDNDQPVNPPAPALAITSFSRTLPNPLPPGVTHTTSASDPVFGTQLAPGSSVTITYGVTFTLPAAAAQLITSGRAFRVVFRLSTTASPVPVDAVGIADGTALFSGYDGVIQDPTVSVQYQFPLTVKMVTQPAGTILPLGGSMQFTVPFPAPPQPLRGQPPADTAETEASYQQRLNGFSVIGYDVRATVGGHAARGDVQATTGGTMLPSPMPRLAATTSGATSIPSGAPASFVVTIRNVGPLAAKTVTLRDSLGGSIAGNISLPLPASNGTGTATVTIPGSSVLPGTLSDVVTVAWTDRNDNPYGNVSGTYTATVTQSTQTLSLLQTVPVAVAEVSGSDLLRTMTFGSGGVMTAPLGGWQLPGSATSRTREAASARDQAPGRSTVDATDITVWLAGLPVRIGRRYDSLGEDQVGDFGHGWQLDLQPRLELAAAQSPALALGDGRRMPFALAFAPYSGLIRSLVKPAYVPVADAVGTLTSDGCSLVTLDEGRPVCFMGGGAEFVPSTYRYTDLEGRALSMGASGELLAIEAADGSALTFDRDGILVGGGQRVVRFARDAEGRIARIVVPDAVAGDSVYRYDYDPAGDLRVVTLPDGSLGAEYTYEPVHHLSAMKDPDGAPRTIGLEGGSLTQKLAGSGLACGSAQPIADELVSLSPADAPVIALCR